MRASWNAFKDEPIEAIGFVFYVVILLLAIIFLYGGLLFFIAAAIGW